MIDIAIMNPMNRLAKYTVLVSIFVGSFLGFVGTVFAQIPGSGGGSTLGSGGSSIPGSGGPPGSSLINPLGQSCNSLSCPATKVINFLFTIAVPLCAIMVLVGGFQMMTSSGDPEKFGQGKKTILYAVIGFAVILISGSVATLIQSFFGSSS